MQGHRIGPHRHVEPGWLQAGDLCGGLSVTPSLTCLGRVMLYVLLHALDLSAGVLWDTLPSTQGFPWSHACSWGVRGALHLLCCLL